MKMRAATLGPHQLCKYCMQPCIERAATLQSEHSASMLYQQLMNPTCIKTLFQRGLCILRHWCVVTHCSSPCRKWDLRGRPAAICMKHVRAPIKLRLRQGGKWPCMWPYKQPQHCEAEAHRRGWTTVECNNCCPRGLAERYFTVRICGYSVP